MMSLMSSTETLTDLAANLASFKGYTSAERRAMAEGGPPAKAPEATIETTFF